VNKEIADELDATLFDNSSSSHRKPSANMPNKSLTSGLDESLIP